MYLADPIACVRHVVLTCTTWTSRSATWTSRALTGDHIWKAQPEVQRSADQIIKSYIVKLQPKDSGILYFIASLKTLSS